MIEVRGLKKTFDGFAALDGADLSVPRGAVYGLVGPHGAGTPALLRRFVAGVKKIPGVALYGDFDHERTAVAALNIGDMDSGEVSDILSEDYGIATRPGAHCAPRLHKALGTEEQGAVRFSFGWYNTEEEADAAVNALREIAT